MLDELNIKFNMLMLDRNNSHHHSFFEIEFNCMKRAIDTFDSKLFLDMKSTIPINSNELIIIQCLRKHSFLAPHDPSII